MVPDLFFYQLVLVALMWLCLMLHWVWPSDHAAACPTTPPSTLPSRKRSREPKPFAGLTRKPHCDACAHVSAPRPHASAAPPPRIVPTRGRPRQVDTSSHFCPHPHCVYRGRVGRVPAGCGECFRTSPNPSERGQSAGEHHSKPVFKTSCTPLGLHLSTLRPSTIRSSTHADF